MLKITVATSEGFDETSNEFVVAESVELELEHSLASLSKWESREQKPFISKEGKSTDEILRYVVDMTLTPNVPAGIYTKFSAQDFEDVNNYINSAMTATTFHNMNERPSREIVTAEIIYHWMIALSIPFECQYWHLNRLITLVKVCNEKNKPANKRKFTKQAAATRAETNRQRQQQYGTQG